MLRTNFVESVSRLPFFRCSPPTRMWVSSRRLPMMHRFGWDGPRATSNTCYAWFIWDRRGTPAPPGDAGRVGSSGGKVLPRARRAISIGDALHSPRASAMGRSIKGPRVRLSGEYGVRLRCNPIMFASGAGGGSRLEAMEANRRCFAARHAAGTSTRPDVDGSPKRSPWGINRAGTEERPRSNARVGARCYPSRVGVCGALAGCRACSARRVSRLNHSGRS